MRRILKYIYLIIVVLVAFVRATTNEPCLSDREPQTDTSSHNVELCYFESTPSCSNICLPQHTSGVTLLHVQGTPIKRVCNAHKNNFEFVKFGKVVNAGIRSTIQKQSSNIFRSFTKPAHKLISLGKLII